MTLPYFSVRSRCNCLPVFPTRSQKPVPACSPSYYQCARKVDLSHLARVLDPHRFRVPHLTSCEICIPLVGLGFSADFFFASLTSKNLLFPAPSLHLFFLQFFLLDPLPRNFPQYCHRFIIEQGSSFDAHRPLHCNHPFLHLDLTILSFQFVSLHLFARPKSYSERV